MPQQQALTSGFMCIVACEASGAEPPASSMADLANGPKGARDGVCEAPRVAQGGASARARSRATASLCRHPCTTATITSTATTTSTTTFTTTAATTATNRQRAALERRAARNLQRRGDARAACRGGSAAARRRRRPVRVHRARELPGVADVPRRRLVHRPRGVCAGRALAKAAETRAHPAPPVRRGLRGAGGRRQRGATLHLQLLGRRPGLSCGERRSDGRARHPRATVDARPAPWPARAPARQSQRHERRAPMSIREPRRPCRTTEDIETTYQTTGVVPYNQSERATTTCIGESPLA
jgi:hypothetical protein